MRSSPAKGAGAGAGAAGLAGCEGARTGCALRVCAGRGAGFFFATFFLTGGVFLRVIGFLAGAFCRLGLAFFLVAICVLRSALSVIGPQSTPPERKAARGSRSTKIVRHRLKPPPRFPGKQRASGPA